MTVYNKQHGQLIHEPLILKDTQITEYHDYQKLQEQIYLFAKKNESQNPEVVFPELTSENKGGLMHFLMLAQEAFRDAGKKGRVKTPYEEEIQIPKLNWKEFLKNAERRKRYHKIDFTKVKMPEGKEEHQVFQNTIRSYFQALREESKRDLTIVFPKLSSEDEKLIIPFLTRTARDYGIYLGYRQKAYDVPEKKWGWQEALKRDMTSLDKIELDFSSMMMPTSEEKEPFVRSLRNFLIQNEDKRIKYNFANMPEELQELVEQAGGELKARKLPKNHFLAQRRTSEHF